MQSTWAALYCYLWPSDSTVFFHTTSQTKRFSEKLLLKKIVFLFSIQFLREAFLILRRIQWNFTSSLMKNFSYSFQILLKHEIIDRLWKCKKFSKSKFIEHPSNCSHWVQPLLKKTKIPPFISTLYGICESIISFLCSQFSHCHYYETNQSLSQPN
jgi:hypothetical protein